MRSPVFVIVIMAMTLLAPSFVLAQVDAAPPRPTIGDDHTAREEATGKALWSQLRNGSTQCADLTDAGFGSLGEYLMGQMMGPTHAAMNATMTRILGEDGEEQMHVVMGKRMSGCVSDAALPPGAANIMPMMMGGMMGSWSPPSGTGWNRNTVGMMGFTPWGSGWWGGIGIVLWWALIILAVVVLVRWIAGQSGSGRGKSAREILEERYARGNIEKEEFEEKRRALDGR